MKGKKDGETNILYPDKSSFKWKAKRNLFQANPGIKKYIWLTCPIHDTSWNYPLDALERNENKKSKIRYLWYKRTIAMEQKPDNHRTA